MSHGGLRPIRHQPEHVGTAFGFMTALQNIFLSVVLVSAGAHPRSHASSTFFKTFPTLTALKQN